jgi:hypothetical protein
VPENIRTPFYLLYPGKCPHGIFYAPGTGNRLHIEKGIISL